MFRSFRDPSALRRTRVRFPLIHWITLAFGWGALMTSTASAASQVMVLNLSPGDAPSLSFDFGGVAQVDALPYKGQTTFITLPDGDLQLRVRNPAGQVVIDQTITVIPGRQQIIAAAGDGHRRPMVAYHGLLHELDVGHGKLFIQDEMLSTHGGPGDPVTRNLDVLTCENPRPLTVYPPPSAQQTNDGYALRNNGGKSAHADFCFRFVHVATHADGQVETVSSTYTPHAGERVFVLAIGDGQRHPYEHLILSLGIRATVPEVQLGEAMDGLWYDPERPGEGLSLLYHDERLHMLYYGFDEAGRNLWGSTTVAITEPPSITQTLQVFRGGSPEGQQPAAPSGFVLLTQLRFHSCNSASFSSTYVSELMPHTETDVLRSRRIYKLLPVDDCSALSSPESTP